MDHELQAAAKDILNSISYMTLGTADERGARTVLLDQVRGSGPYRLYRAVSHETWMLDRESHPDRRVSIKLAN